MIEWKKIFYLSFLLFISSARVAQLVERQAFNLNVQGSSPCSGDKFFTHTYYWIQNIQTSWRMKFFSKHIFDYWSCTNVQIYLPLFPDDMQYLSFKRLREFGRKCSDYLLINKIFCLSAWWLKISQLFVYYFSNTSFLSCSWKRVTSTFLTLSSLN